MELNLKTRSLWFALCNLVSIIFTPGYGWCGKCKGRWNIVEKHTTWYHEGTGCFALCEDCWTELKTPEARMWHYKHLVFGVQNAPKEWPAVRQAVLDGK